MRGGRDDQNEGRSISSDTPNIKRDITMRLGVLARMIRGSFDRRVASYNVTRSQWTMIIAVRNNPGASQRMIAEMLEMSEASAGRLVDRLVAEGLLERRDRPDDRRARAVYLAEGARPLLDKLQEVGGELESTLFAQFSEDELATLSELLDRLYGSASRL